MAVTGLTCCLVWDTPHGYTWKLESEGISVVAGAVRPPDIAPDGKVLVQRALGQDGFPGMHLSLGSADCTGLYRRIRMDTD
ncbi:Uncharacterised protein [Mycobacteroides abscessus subsp. massiliense]|nr:Uncharacterised protein [Mycobacteroides abscessus subsp. massiliense]